MTLMTFAMGGIAFWMPTFLQRAPHELGEGLAATVFGGITVVAGLLGTAIGGVLGDRAERARPGGYLVISGWGLLIGAPFVAVMPLIDSLPLALACAFVAEVFLFLNTGPLNAALVGSVPPAMRATAVSINVFCIHAFGDAGSPYILGLLSRSSSLAWAIAFCAIPVAIGGLVLTLGVRHRPP
jgi:MFS family permease